MDTTVSRRASGRWLPLAIALACVVPLGWTIASRRDSSGHWLAVARDSSYTISIDTSRITRGYGAVYWVWYRTDHSVTRLYKGKEFNREIVHSVLQCDYWAFKVVSVDMYLGAGRHVSAQRTDPGELGQQRWRPVERGTIEAVAAQATCDFARRHPEL